MKLFKRLLAVALAGMMALTVLTGCSSVNEKEILAILNDTLKTPLVESRLPEKEIKEFKAADAEVNNKTNAVAKLINEAEVAEGEDIKDVIAKLNDADKIENILVGENDTNQYMVGYATKVSYDSKLFNTFKDGLDVVELLLNAMKNSYNGQQAGREMKDATALVGFKDVTVNGKVYTIAVIKAPTVEAPATGD